MSTEQRVKHLWDCALSVGAETHSKKLIKSYLINVCRKVARKSDNIPMERFAPSQMCERCSTHWQDNEFRMKLRPQTLNVKSSKARRLISKLKEQESNKEQRLLTKKQKKRAKWLLKHIESKVEIKCGFCEHKTLVPLSKPSKQKTETETAQNVIETPTVATLSKNKKKKKSKNTTAGLKIPQAKKVELSTKGKKTVRDMIGSKVPLKQTKNVQNPKTTKSKAKNPNKKEAPKVQSKTQKQNSLLQLAALLKSKDQSKANNSAVNRMESLLE